MTSARTSVAPESSVRPTTAVLNVFIVVPLPMGAVCTHPPAIVRGSRQNAKRGGVAASVKSKLRAVTYCIYRRALTMSSAERRLSILSVFQNGEAVGIVADSGHRRDDDARIEIDHPHGPARRGVGSETRPARDDRVASV